MLVQAYVLTIVLIYPKTTFGLCFPLFREGVINMFKGGGAVPISHRSILKCLPPLILINHIQKKFHINGDSPKFWKIFFRTPLKSCLGPSNQI